MAQTLRLLLGGSPCTFWSCSQTKHRETVPAGNGWELFRNYLIARDKYAPDYFLYENNQSMSASIREQITTELGVEPIMINSALVSAQNRRRLFWTNISDVHQPIDRGILLKDILESGDVWQDKSHCVTATEYKGVTLEHNLTHHVRTLAAENLDTYSLIPGEESGNNAVQFLAGLSLNGEQRLHDGRAYSRNFSQGKRLYGVEKKSVTVTASGSGLAGHAGLYAVPAGIARRGRHGGSQYEMRGDGKANAITAAGHDNRLVIEAAGGQTFPVYEVKDGRISVNGRQYPIRLADGLYIIRKLSVRECMRLQTVPENYVFPVSDTQAYRMLGNGWTVQVVAHILSFCPQITAKPVEVLSMYDGMSCGHIALELIGADVVRYYATEIDKYAVATTLTNYPDTVQLGDAFQVRASDWRLTSE